MRTSLVALLVTFAVTRAAIADTISPGIELAAVRQTLKKFDYEVNARKYGLSLDSGDKNIFVDFCRIDDEITLVIAYDRRSRKVSGLDLVFIADGQTSADSVIREAREITFDKDGTYAVKFKRKVK